MAWSRAGFREKIVPKHSARPAPPTLGSALTILGVSPYTSATPVPTPRPGLLRDHDASLASRAFTFRPLPVLHSRPRHVPANEPGRVQGRVRTRLMQSLQPGIQGPVHPRRTFSLVGGCPGHPDWMAYSPSSRRSFASSCARDHSQRARPSKGNTPPRCQPIMLPKAAAEAAAPPTAGMTEAPHADQSLSVRPD